MHNGVVVHSSAIYAVLNDYDILYGGGNYYYHVEMMTTFGEMIASTASKDDENKMKMIQL